MAAAKDIRATLAEWQWAMRDLALIRRPLIGKAHVQHPNRTKARNPKRIDRSARPRLDRTTAPDMGGDTVSSGIEVTWTTTPAQWSNNFFENLFHEGTDRSPAGAIQWVAKDAERSSLTAHDPSKSIKPTMVTIDVDAFSTGRARQG